MAKADLKVELRQRYCPVCRIDTQHYFIYQLHFCLLFRVDRQVELSSGCSICNPDRYWGLKLATEFDQEKFLAERWMPKVS